MTPPFVEKENFASFVDRDFEIEKHRLLSEIADEAIKDLFDITAKAAQRMACKPFTYGNFSLQEGSQLNVWVTDEPDSIFNKTMYTITSSEVFGGLGIDLSAIYPAGRLAFEQRQTHRGFSLALIEAFLSHLSPKLSLEGKSDFVWLGTKLDAEQFVIESNISANGAENDARLYELFFNAKTPEFLGHDSNSLQLHPTLRKMLQAVNDKDLAVLQSPEICNYRKELLDALFECGGIRSAWYTIAQNILSGEDNDSDSINLDDMENALWLASKRDIQRSAEGAQVLILEIDIGAISETSAFHLGRRQPGAIGSLHQIPAHAIRAAYYDPVDGEPHISSLFDEHYGHILLRPLSELPENLWLEDKQGNVVTPDAVRIEEISRTKPLCQVRYDGSSAVPTFVQHLLEGKIVPFSFLSTNVLRNLDHTKVKDLNDKQTLYWVVREALLSLAKSTDEWKELLALLGDEAENEILKYIERKENVLLMQPLNQIVTRRIHH